MSVSKFERELDGYYERLRNQELRRRLDEITSTMRETLLLYTVYEELTGTQIEPSAEAQTLVKSTRSAWNSNDFVRVEENIEELEAEVREEKSAAKSQIQSEKHDMLGHLRGLKSLNQVVQQVEASRINSLEAELKTLDAVSYRPDQAYDEQEVTIREHVRDNVIAELDKIEDELIGPFIGSKIEEHVQSLVNGNPIPVSKISDGEFGELKESKLGQHLSIKLG